MGKTTIEWTDASWNPVVGCTEVSPGCANCYAAQLASTRLKNHPDYKGLAILNRVNHPRWTGDVCFLPGRLEEPLHWKKPRRIFVCDMGDLFHETCAVTWIEQIFGVMAICKQHTFQVLTKRASIARTLLSSETFRQYAFQLQSNFLKSALWHTWGWPLPNVWLGVSVESQHFADERIPLLLQTPAAVRFLSCEPLLGPVEIRRYLERHHPGEFPGQDGRVVDWVICGGESGSAARPMHPDWARSLRDQCVAAGVPFFFKQWGEWLPFGQFGGPGCHVAQQDAKVGKKAAGRLLDGREWNEFPK